MNPQQLQAYNDSIQCCIRLINQLEQDKETIRSCFRGEPLQTYLKATEMAIQRTRMLKATLENLQQMQP